MMDPRALARSSYACLVAAFFLMVLQPAHSSFDLGVASFDPGQSTIVLWTWFNTSQQANTTADISIDWYLYTDVGLTTISQNGTVTALASADHTAAVRLSGLSSYTTYYYKFFQTSTPSVSSVTGQTRTLPAVGQVSTVKLAVVSCVNYPAGYFNAYEDIANSDVDVVIHGGDYIYEYGVGEYGTTDSTASLGREHIPSNEIVSLSDYRRRYQQYRGDPQTMLMHRLKPMIATWDDHEFADNAFLYGAFNHNVSSEGSWNQRVSYAAQAWHEYLPTYQQPANPVDIWRSFDFGEHLSLYMLENRVSGRQKQMEYADYIYGGKLDQTAFFTALNSPSREMISGAQYDWLINSARSSTATWQVMGTPVLMGQVYVPLEMALAYNTLGTGMTDLNTAINAFLTVLQETIELKTKEKAKFPLSDEDKVRLENRYAMNLDSWDGYPAQRDRILAALSGKNVLTLAGDTHNAWYNWLVNSTNVVGREFAGMGMTSQGIDTYTAKVTGATTLAELAISSLADEVRWVDAEARGWMKITFNSNTARRSTPSVTAEYIELSTVTSTSFTTSVIFSQTLTPDLTADQTAFEGINSGVSARPISLLIAAGLMMVAMMG